MVLKRGIWERVGQSLGLEEIEDEDLDEVITLREAIRSQEGNGEEGVVH